MLNFLPQKNKNQIILEYLLRVMSFLLLFVFASSLILISLFVPSFFFVKYKSDTINDQLELAKQKNINIGEDSAVFIKNVNRLAAVLSDINTLTYSDIINKVMSLKNKDIKISSIIITVENTTGIRKILINGIANTRDSLTTFEKEVKIGGTFKDVLFPVSNFIKNSDSSFSVTLTL
ncbi:MAG: hypothetical protein ABIF22_00495 [bacterium]